MIDVVDVDGECLVICKVGVVIKVCYVMYWFDVLN